MASSSHVNFLTDEGEDSKEDEDSINEGIVGKKYIAMKPYIRDASTSKDFKCLMQELKKIDCSFPALCPRHYNRLKRYCVLTIPAIIFS